VDDQLAVDAPEGKETENADGGNERYAHTSRVKSWPLNVCSRTGCG
jgi:hypothetical protein